MMDSTLQLLDRIIPMLHILVLIAIILKTALIFLNKGFDIPAVFASFFRIYAKSEFAMTDNSSRQFYMKMNNILNYYCYVWIVLTLINIVVFQKSF